MWKALLRAIAILALIVAIGLGIAQDQEVLRVESAIAASDPDFPGYVAALTGTAVTSGNRYGVLVNGDRIFPPMVDAIRRARRRISFETYVYVAGAMADQFTAALVDAARRGVTCNLVLDAIGAKDVASDHVERLKAAGCRVGKFNETAWYQLEELNYRTHRKILVVDGEVGFIGGVGVADYWMGDADSPDHWRDTQIRIEGPALGYVEAGFYENFIESVGPIVPVLDWQPPAGDGGRSLVLWSSPVSGSSSMKLLYLLSIAGARRAIDICSPYFVMDESTGWAIDRAVDRGVRVRILVEGDVTDAKPVKFASRADYEHLLARGVQIYEYQPTMMHAKTMVVDGTWSVVGSANFDNRSLELNDELNAGVFDAAVASRLTVDFEADLTRSKRLDLAAWRERSALEKIRERFWSLFGEVF
jgi:cardiolipin synthase